MIHEGIGNFGHFAVILSFISSLIAAYGYYQMSRKEDILEVNQWRRFSRAVFFTHFGAVVAVVGTLFFIIINHYFEYYYAYDHSSLSMPTKYILACFWEGQEGSFLLWIFWHVLLGLVFIFANRQWEAPAMTVFMLVQAFLASMILGVVIPGLNVKIGSSPFILLRDAMSDAPIFKTQPNFIPEDGSGLNALLQNYWMVIHPPTLFLGYAATLVPFAFAIAGLWYRKYTEWIKPAMPWTLFAVFILGTGIIMGGVWAYETLNFGGYWNWDPVENGVYIPWLTLVAGLHTMLLARKNGTALKASLILVVSTFILVLYATFITRSGILGNASVHSFTDLGLSGQLLIYLLVFTFIAIVLMIREWKRIPSADAELAVYTREFWIFMGITVLGLAAFQVLVPTSIPVWNKIVELFGAVSNVAPPADQIEFYTQFQLWFFIVIAILSAVGQFFWWKRYESAKSLNWLVMPLLIALLLAALIASVAKVAEWQYIILLYAASFSLIVNGRILWMIIRNGYKLSGGAISHMGVALMLIGILFSSGYSKVVSLNMTGLMYSRGEDFTKDDNKENKENTLLWINEPTRMDKYIVTYKGKRAEVKGVPGYVDPKLLGSADVPFRAVATNPIEKEGKVYYQKGDTVRVYPENTYYEVEYRDEEGRVFTLYPRVQKNGEMGGYAISPDIQKEPRRDLYTFVNYDPGMAGEKKEWSKPEEFTAHKGDTLYLNDYVAVLDDVTRVTDIPGIVLTSSDAAVKANIRILGKTQEYIAQPTFVIKDRMVGQMSETINDLGLRVSFLNVNPATGEFTFGVSRTQKDFIILKAIEKPYINILWIGSIVMLIGFVISIFRWKR
ncbi:cytochrome c biogenesis protein CcsA [Xanthocytophaga agilis]|uniref:Cytochrome c biogenesis protein CcsA n=1 Tax=Xanthocytophaga agilis TaxID=3048010 RepID=A0AAE3R4T8_9BACT|nr:cytochrome c biogenesis protein CcsA [Xanthocytophaga agilis]MDJ1503210.1 cytochrome c biogenesis protein CcsA [Xanthocytophaga agilis]